MIQGQKFIAFSGFDCSTMGRYRCMVDKFGICYVLQLFSNDWKVFILMYCEGVIFLWPINIYFRRYPERVRCNQCRFVSKIKLECTWISSFRCESFEELGYRCALSSSSRSLNLYGKWYFVEYINCIIHVCARHFVSTSSFIQVHLLVCVTWSLPVWNFRWCSIASAFENYILGLLFLLL